MIVSGAVVTFLSWAALLVCAGVGLTEVFASQSARWPPRKLFIILLIAILAVVACRKLYARELVSKAVIASSAGKEQLALERVTDAIRIDPHNERGYILRASLFEKLGKWDLAERDLNAIQRPKDVQIFFDRAQLLARMGETKQALAEINRYLAGGHNPKALVLRALLYMQMNQPRQAISDWTAALQREPNQAEALYNRSLAYLAVRDYPKAYRDLVHSDALRPDYDTKVNLGNVAWLLGNRATALDAYSQAISLNPTGANAYYNRGTKFLELGQYDRAVQDLTSALKIQPDDATALEARGAAYLRLGDVHKAEKDFADAAKVHAEAPNPHERASVHFDW